MRIKEVTDEYILFDNYSRIWFDHKRECCEDNFADFEQLETGAFDEDFSEDLIFEENEYGFRFGSKSTPMYFVPCYSDQSGYYTDEIDIYYNRDIVIKGLGCLERSDFEQ